jgi:hypothetical protein
MLQALNDGLQEKHFRRLRVITNSTLQILFGKEAITQHSEIAQSSKHADTFTDGTVSPWVLFVKSTGCESYNRFVHPCNEPSILKRKKQKQPWIPKTRLLKLGSQAFMLTNIKISQEKFQHLRKNASCNFLRSQKPIIFKCCFSTLTNEL